jgi:hypothetical protein
MLHIKIFPKTLAFIYINFKKYFINKMIGTFIVLAILCHIVYSHLSIPQKIRVVNKIRDFVIDLFPTDEQIINSNFKQAKPETIEETQPEEATPEIDDDTEIVENSHAKQETPERTVTKSSSWSFF